MGEGVLRETRHFVEDLDSLGYMGLKTRQKKRFRYRLQSGNGNSRATKL